MIHCENSPRSPSANEGSTCIDSLTVNFQGRIVSLYLVTHSLILPKYSRTAPRSFCGPLYFRQARQATPSITTSQAKKVQNIHLPSSYPFVFFSFVLLHNSLQYPLQLSLYQFILKKAIMWFVFLLKLARIGCTDCS